MRIQASSDTGRLEVLVEHRDTVHVDLDLVVAAVRDALTDALTELVIETETEAPEQAEQVCDVATPMPLDVATSRGLDAGPEDAAVEAGQAGEVGVAGMAGAPDLLERGGRGVRSLEREMRPRALELLDEGVPETEVCHRLGITRALLARWDGDPDPATPGGRMLAAAGGAR